MCYYAELGHWMIRSSSNDRDRCPSINGLPENIRCGDGCNLFDLWGDLIAIDGRGGYSRAWLCYDRCCEWWKPGVAIGLKRYMNGLYFFVNR